MRIGVKAIKLGQEISRRMRAEPLMAQNVQIVLTDDIDGSEAAETIRFGLDGAQYEIDLSADHAEQLRNALDPFRAAARKASTKGGVRSTDRAPQGAGGGETAKVRAWAKQNGLEVSDRGRINAKVLEAYRAAQK